MREDAHRSYGRLPWYLSVLVSSVSSVDRDRSVLTYNVSLAGRKGRGYSTPKSFLFQMFIPRMRHLLGVLALLSALLLRVSAALPTELAEAVSWYDTLGYPNTTELPYVRVTRDAVFKRGENPPQRIMAEGFLVHEDPEGFTVFICGVSDFGRPLWLPAPYSALTTRRFLRKPDASA